MSLGCHDPVSQFINGLWILLSDCIENIYVSISFSRLSSSRPESVTFHTSQCLVQNLLLTRCHVWLSLPLWTVARQTPLSMGFSRQEYWSGLPFPSPGDLPNPETEPASPALAGDFFTTEPLGSPHENFRYKYNVPVLDFPNLSMLFIF